VKFSTAGSAVPIISYGAPSLCIDGEQKTIPSMGQYVRKETRSKQNLGKCFAALQVI